jgi:hypothetical protein
VALTSKLATESFDLSEDAETGRGWSRRLAHATDMIPSGLFFLRPLLPAATLRGSISQYPKGGKKKSSLCDLQFRDPAGAGSPRHVAPPFRPFPRPLELFFPPAAISSRIVRLLWYA